MAPIAELTVCEMHFRVQPVSLDDFMAKTKRAETFHSKLDFMIQVENAQPDFHHSFRM